MIRTGKKFSKPEMSRVINGDTVLKEAEKPIEKHRLDILMTEIFRSYNRSTLQKFITAGYVKVNGVLAKKSNQKFPSNVKISLNVPKELRNADVIPEKIYEDDQIIVVNKPSGLLSEARRDFCAEKTLEDFGYICHRLDRDTSGVMVVAKNPEAQEFVKKQFLKRTVHKTYYAIVEGVPKYDEARIDLPIIRNLKHPTTFRVDPNGKSSETFYKVLKTNGKLSLVELKPITGRTHQLRVHMKYLGHPILGDRVYGTTKADRLYLHASKIQITLPSGERKIFESPLPKEFQTVLKDQD